METNIKTIKLGGLSGNCYLIKTTMGFILIVTGGKLKYQELEEELSELACTSDNLNLIIFTHKKSFNYINYEYLREKYKAKIAMHILDEDLIDDTESKNIWRGLKNLYSRVFMITNHKNAFKPDLIIDEGYNLSLYGLNARVLYLPGHSKTVGILTENGELFCDDLLVNNTVKNDSVKLDVLIPYKFRKFLIDTVYPGHGKPFQVGTLKV
jgi:glyoxylase-like metal-dependent hydrolase (beta-lactamase superfamily II)